MSGAPAGLRIVEFTGLGPAPFAGMMLADHGAEVIRIERFDAREGYPGFDEFDVLARSRKTILLDLKSEDGRDVARDLAAAADGLIEGFRPGVLERLGLGPDEMLVRNPRLVYGRVTGWGQHGPISATAGHDINYIAINGVLNSIGSPRECPTIPVNYLGDFGGGGMLLAFGMTAALLAVARGGPGQIIDAAMVDGSALLSAMVWQMKAAGIWPGAAGANLLDGGAPFYDVYRCADGKDIAVGAIEPEFYARLRASLGLTPPTAPGAHMDSRAWPAIRAELSEAIASRPRDTILTQLADADACVAPVLSFEDALEHPQIAARRTYIEVAGQLQPAPAPRFSETPAAEPRRGGPAGSHARELLAAIGYPNDRIAQLIKRGTVG